MGIFFQGIDKWDLFRYLDCNSFTDFELMWLRRILISIDPDYGAVFPFYELCLKIWPNPELSEDFRREFPTVSGRLDTPEKIRIFFRAAKSLDIPPYQLGFVCENYLNPHHEIGDKVVSILSKGQAKGVWGRALEILDGGCEDYCATSLREALFRGNLTTVK